MEIIDMFSKFLAGILGLVNEDIILAFPHESTDAEVLKMVELGVIELPLVLHYHLLIGGMTSLTSELDKLAQHESRPVTLGNYSGQMLVGDVIGDSQNDSLALDP